MYKFYGKQWLSLSIIILCSNLYAQKNNVKIKSTEMNTSEFKSLIWDFTEDENNFMYKGKKPAIINFYSPQAATSKVSISILDELTKDYKSKCDVFKINAEQEAELIRLFQIKDYPAFLLVTKKGEPQVYVGFKTKEQLAQLIDLAILK